MLADAQSRPGMRNSLVTLTLSKPDLSYQADGGNTHFHSVLSGRRKLTPLLCHADVLQTQMHDNRAIRIRKTSRQNGVVTRGENSNSFVGATPNSRVHFINCQPNSSERGMEGNEGICPRLRMRTDAVVTESLMRRRRR
jgi:hypothetical protein